MSSVLVGAQHPLPPLSDVAVQGGARARANIPAALGGRSRFLAEFLGAAVADGNNPCAPITGASGTPGHEHSGGVMGRPLQHTFWCMALGYGPDDIANVSDGQSPAQGVTSGSLPSNASSPRVLFDDTINVFVPPSGAAPSMWGGDGSCYSLCAMSVTVRSSTTSAATATITCHARANGMTATWDGTVAASSRAVIHSIDEAPSQKVKLIPGHVNQVRLRVTVTRGAGDATVAINSAAIHQVLDDATP